MVSFRHCFGIVVVVVVREHLQLCNNKLFRILLQKKKRKIKENNVIILKTHDLKCMAQLSGRVATIDLR